MKACLLLYIFTIICPPAQFVPSYTGISTALLFTGLIIYLITNGKCVSLKQNKFIFVMLLIYVLSQAQTLYLYGTLLAIKFWICKAILYYLLINTVLEERDFRRVIWSLILATSVLIWYGWDLYINNPELLDLGDRIRAFGEYNLCNSFGLLLTVVWPLGFFLMELEKGNLKKVFLIAFLIASFVTLAFTKSRGSLLGFGTAVARCVIFSRNVFRSKGVRS